MADVAGFVVEGRKMIIFERAQNDESAARLNGTVRFLNALRPPTSEASYWPNDVFATPPSQLDDQRQVRR
ncbi:hypothetical protein [Streptomyces deccanensis]|uniref:hypothetical protein n=1 Tax=Streptomyces deccanensis TaxID=424188 RepID=UPI001EFA5DD4|nr:hypothetical protein [Streptomyces deccanensis]ULR54980.1 hypothetical protein L3078_40030 [Streptomyces deccanensis]